MPASTTLLTTLLDGNRRNLRSPTATPPQGRTANRARRRNESRQAELPLALAGLETVPADLPPQPAPAMLPVQQITSTIRPGAAGQSSERRSGRRVLSASEPSDPLRHAHYLARRLRESRFDATTRRAAVRALCEDLLACLAGAPEVVVQARSQATGDSRPRLR